jgi:D-alanyl-D-alanine carboxypeptidase
MAKMMTTDVAFELIDKGQLPLSKMCTVRPETWQKWHGTQAGSTMFLSANEQVSVENLLKGIVTLSGNDASVVLAECIAGTEQAFTGQMNELAKKIGLTNSHFGTANGWPDNGVTYVSARDLATLRGGRSRTTTSSTSNSTRCRTSPGARRLGRMPTSPRQTAIQSWAKCRAPTGSRRGTRMRQVTASPARPIKMGAG